MNALGVHYTAIPGASEIQWVGDQRMPVPKTRGNLTIRRSALTTILTMDFSNPARDLGCPKSSRSWADQGRFWMQRAARPAIQIHGAAK